MRQMQEQILRFTLVGSIILFLCLSVFASPVLADEIREECQHTPGTEEVSCPHDGVHDQCQGGPDDPTWNCHVTFTPSAGGGAPTTANIPGCIQDWENAMTVSGIAGVRIENQYKDNQPVDPIRFTYRMPADRDPSYPGSVSFGVGATAETNLYTQIFANMMSSLTPFLATNKDLFDITLKDDPQKLQVWERQNCIYGANDQYVGDLGIHVGSSFKYMALVEETETTHCTTDPVDGTRSCDKSGNPFDCSSDGAGGETCKVHVTRPEPKDYTTAPDQTGHGTFMWPYVSRALREIAKKTAFTLKEQWCSTSNTKTCFGPYICEKVTDPGILEQMSHDVSANNKDGICTLAYEPQLTSETIVRTICSPTEPFLPDQIGSKICIYSNGFHFTDPANITTETDAAGNPTGATYNPDTGATDKTNLPYVTDGQVKEGTDLLPFDTSLFANNNEMGNPNCDETTATPDMLKNCQRDGYYRRFLEKAGVYRPDEIDIVSAIPVKAGTGGTFKFDDVKAQPGESNNKWVFDFIEKLGGYSELSNDLRFLNHELRPAGYDVMADGGHRVYVRGINGLLRGMVYIDNVDDGKLMMAKNYYVGTTPKKIQDVQAFPFIYTQATKPGFVVSFEEFHSKYNATGYIYISRDGHNGELLQVPGTDGLLKSYQTSPMVAFMNSEGDVIVLANFPLDGPGGQPKSNYYTIYGKQGFTPWVRLPQDISFLGQYALDAADNLHVVGTPGRPDGEGHTFWGMSKLDYHKYKFSNGTLAELGHTNIPLNLNGFEYKTILPKPISIQADVGCGETCGAHIAVSVHSKGTGSGHNFESDILYFYANGTTENPIRAIPAVERPLSSDARPQNTEHFSVINSMQGAGSNIVFYQGHVYIVYQTNYYYSDEDHPPTKSVREINMARADGGGANWIQDIPLSSKMLYTLGRVGYGNVSDATISRDGKISFTMLEAVSKFNTATKSFDGAGWKQCVLEPEEYQDWGDTRCGSLENIKYIVAPNKSDANQITYIDPPKP